MDKKKVINLFLIGVLLILGVCYAGAAINWIAITGDIANITFTGTVNNTNIRGQTILTKGGESNTFNFTFNTSGYMISSINITIPANNYTSLIPGNYYNGTSNTTANFLFSNFSIPSGTQIVWLKNATFGDINSSSPSNDLSVWINVTTNFTGEGNNNVQWTIQVNLSTGSISTVNRTYMNFSIDGLIPRVSQINVSDGNTTLINGTNLNLNTTLGIDSPLTIRLTLNELNPQNVWLYYLINNSNNATFTKGADTNATLIAMSTSSTTSPYLYNATIPASRLRAYRDYINATNSTSFVFYVNDTVDNWIMINSTINSVFVLNLTSNILKVGAINASDGTYIRTDANLRAGNKFLGANRPLIITTGVTGEMKDAVILYYSASGEPNTTSPNITMNNIAFNVTGIAIYNATIQPGVFNDSSKLRFLIVANDTSNYQTRTRFNFTVDGVAPTIGVPTVSSSSVTPNTAVTITCATASDADSVLTYTAQLNTPGSGDYESHSGSSYITGTDETGTAGTYYTKCIVTDSTGHSTTSGETTFTVSGSTSSTSSGSSGGSSSSGGTTVTETTEISEGETQNLGTLTQSISNNVIAGLNSVAAFTMATSSTPATTSSHSITVSEITDNSVTIIIESDPITLTLEIGETQNVDVDGDEVDDLEITLNDITDGKADFTVNTLVEAPESPAETAPEQGITPEITEKPSIGWWIVLAIVVIGIVLFLIFKKKRK